MIDAVDFVMRLGGLLIVAGAVYGGIRADLRSARERADEAYCSASLAHRRIDSHLAGG